MRRLRRIVCGTSLIILVLNLNGVESQSNEKGSSFQVNAWYKSIEEVEKMGPAPLLYSFPGSGNSWIRLLLELATGFLTGSFYDDKNLQTILKGEESCADNNLVVKAHNHWNYRWCNIVAGSPRQAPLPEKCSGDRLQRILFIIRDPFSSLWAEYQRRRTVGHVSALLWKDFDKDHFKQYVRRTALLWKFAMQDAALVSHVYPDDGVHFIRYENLLKEETRLTELQRVLEFLRYEASMARIESAFNMSSQFRRESSSESQSRDEIKVTKELAYKILLGGPKNHTIGDLCWGKLKKQASALSYRHINDPPPAFDSTMLDLKKRFEQLQAVNIDQLDPQYGTSSADATRIWKAYCVDLIE